MSTLTIVLIVVGVLVLFVIATFNSLIRLRNRKQEALSDIDVQSKRRYDLIPNLIETVKGYAKQESSVLENVTKARTAAMGMGGSQMEKAQSEDMLTGALKSLFAVSEAYPDLKSNTNFLELQRELSDTENKMMASRRFFNATVMDLNTKIESFPSNVIAGMFGFKKDAFFAVGSEAEKQPVSVKF
jgi:LemA protein